MKRFLVPFAPGVQEGHLQLEVIELAGKEVDGGSGRVESLEETFSLVSKKDGDCSNIMDLTGKSNE
jgi:hypothetical protein